ncbi:4-hydroxy-tetrahydrodipicolinate synthase [Kitasatospora sp. MMS16-BH015]|uniref:dihydrodipicolinate synthase family protein n=1 Tax=Kitasatospora sp. MMS16-BH015 TaxID=2018025 RepID=UPI000CA21AC0|nr:dihydrodipicolinate synthase family protein [Kitasatospora sp. MMS16-BH015]AUG76683.1 4-hydroxy-tetrahydrodipicolinate synthase [Kitasatospora sp. MMS16-BH015]
MELRGVYVPLVTPFAAESLALGEPELKALEALAHSVLDEGAAGLVALGTTAEVATLDEAERAAVVEVCGRVCRERGATLIVGAGSGDTRASARALAGLTGADAALVTVPSFSRPGERGVVAHFEQLAAASAVPLVVYNIPYRTGQSIGADTLRELAALPGVIGVKHAVGSVDQPTVDLLGDTPAGFAVLAGDDPYYSALLALGAPGGILASAHLATGRFAELATAWREGDVARARALGHALAAFSATLFTEPNPAVIKGVLHAQGRLPSAAVRLPLLPAGRASVAHALDRLAALGA